MNLLSSLQSRVFLASALLTVFSIAVAIYLVGARISREASEGVRRDILATGALVEQLRSTRADTLATTARLFADAPKLKAAVETNDPPTVQTVADEYRVRLHAPLLLVTSRTGRVLASIGTSSNGLTDPAARTAVAEALQGRESITVVPAPDGMLQLATVPIAIGLERPDILGSLSVGFLLDDALTAQLKSMTGSDIAFGMNGRVLASTLSSSERAPLIPLLGTSEPQGVTIGEEAFVALALPLSPAVAPRDALGPVALILRSQTDQRRFLQEINTELEVTALVGVLLATLLSFAVARTVTRPLAAITSVMKDMATTGDLTRRIVFRGRRWWQDEDARLLATTLNTLTESIGRFQRDVSQRERLSSLEIGRAHV
mgnify:FL=1